DGSGAERLPAGRRSRLSPGRAPTLLVHRRRLRLADEAVALGKGAFADQVGVEDRAVEDVEAEGVVAGAGACSAPRPGSTAARGAGRRARGGPPRPPAAPPPRERGRGGGAPPPPPGPPPALSPPRGPPPPPPSPLFPPRPPPPPPLLAPPPLPLFAPPEPEPP